MNDVISPKYRRSFRGSDDAVEVIRDRTHLEAIIRNPSNYSRDDFMKEIMSCYSGTAYRNKNWPQIIPAWTKPEEITIHGEFAKKYPTLAQLNLDPGVITHLPELMTYLDSNPTKNKNYWTVRQEFSDHLGKRKLWRGLFIDENDAKYIATNGMHSEFLRNVRCSFDNNKEYFEAEVLSTFFYQLIDTHFHNENYHSPLLSVTGHEDLAIAVGRAHGRRVMSGAKPKELYLFELNVPEINIIHYVDGIVNPPSKLVSAIENNLNVHISVDDKRSSYTWNRDVESYILYKINPSEIVGVTRPKVSRSSWNGREIIW